MSLSIDQLESEARGRTVSTVSHGGHYNQEDLRGYEGDATYHELQWSALCRLEASTYRYDRGYSDDEGEGESCWEGNCVSS